MTAQGGVFTSANSEVERLRQRVEELERELDRLKALGLERQEWRSRMGLSTQDVIVQRAEAAEAKLARCVEALNYGLLLTTSWSDVRTHNWRNGVRAALAAAKGE